MADETILILANGDWGDAFRLDSLVDRADRILAADGAWAKADSLGVRVDRVIGDLDSLTSEEQVRLRASGIPIEDYPADKDFTDLELAVDFALAVQARAMQVRELIVFGAFGGRIDHALANLFLLEKAAERGVAVELIAGDETAWLIDGPFTIPIGDVGDRISLIPLSDSAIVRTDGLRYPLNDEPLRRASGRGVSNAIERTPARIEVHSGRLLAIHGPAEKAEGANS